MITADKVFKGSTPISKIYQGLNLVWEMAAPIPGADAYVQDGLVFQLDGIEKEELMEYGKTQLEIRISLYLIV